MVIRSFGNNEALKLDDVLQLAIVAVVLYIQCTTLLSTLRRLLLCLLIGVHAQQPKTKINGLKFSKSNSAQRVEGDKKKVGGYPLVTHDPNMLKKQVTGN